ncbi:MAG TPA: type II secretion system protein [Verrucomicrobiae bacterium]|nr:type II secretion system protein [Verrucomicrobiae bacterium]
MNAERQGGFSLIELLVSLAILSIVIGVVLDGINTMQARNTVETNKLDLTQQTREFMDQIINDLDQAGFPSLSMFDPVGLTSASDCTQDNNVACGFKYLSTSEIQFEGDVDGSGVSYVDIKLNPPGGPCPCTIQRGAIAKPGTTPLFYTQVDNVMNTAVFTAYDSGGNNLDLTAPITGAGGFDNITAIGITLYVKSSQPDPKTGQYPTVTMVSTAKVNNIQSY